MQTREGALNVFKSQVGGSNFLSGKVWETTSLYLPGGWPQPHSLALYSVNSKEACVKRDAMYLEFLATQVSAFKTSQIWHSLVQAGADTEKQFSWLQSKKNEMTTFPASLLEVVLNVPQRKGHLERIWSTLRPVSFHVEEIKLLHASFLMFERGNFEDMELRIQWLQNCAMNIGAGSETLANVVSVLRKELDHALVRHLYRAWVHFEAVNGRNVVAQQVPYP